MQSLILLLAAAAALGAAACGDAEIRSEPLGPGAYRLTVTGKGVTDEAGARRLLEPTALKLCGDEQARFGRYSFDANEALEPPAESTFTLVQELRCGGPAEAKAASSLPPKDDVLIRRLSDAYLRAHETGQDAAAYALTHSDLHGGQTLEEWTAHARKHRETSGPVENRRFAKLTWYENPPGARPGLYAAVDYVASTEKLAFECGYIVWGSEPDGSFRVTRHERNVASKSDEAAANPEHIAEFKSRFCVE